MRKIAALFYALVLGFVAYGQQVKYGDNASAGKYYDVRGIKMYVEVYGEGKPLLLLHGNGGSISAFSQTIPYFSKKYKVIAVDSRAQGKTIDTKDSLSFEMMADDFSALMEKMKIDSAYVIGWSDGGIDALVLAMRHPKKVIKLASTGANLTPDSTALTPPTWNDMVKHYNSENDGTVSDSQAGLYVWNSSDDDTQFHDCQVYGNIIYNDKLAALCFSEKSESKGIRFFNNVFVGLDSLIKGKDKIGDVKYIGNNWWSIGKRFNIEGIMTFKEWVAKMGNEQESGNIAGLNAKPPFLNPGHTKITSASQLKTFKNYQLPDNYFKHSLIYTSKYGIGNIRQ